MRKSLFLAALAGLLIGAPALAAPVSPAAPPAKRATTQADIDRMIETACINEGGEPKQCACGLDIARDGLTERQFGMFPILWPIVKSKGDTFSKIAAGVTALQAGGYNASDGLALMATGLVVYALSPKRSNPNR